VDGAQVGVLEEAHEVRLRSLSRRNRGNGVREVSESACFRRLEVQS
jgi:hypothetical protein